MKKPPKNDKQLDILEQQTELDKISQDVRLFIAKATGKNVSAMMQKVNGNTTHKEHLDIQRTLNEALKGAGSVPYYPNAPVVNANSSAQIDNEIKIKFV